MSKVKNISDVFIKAISSYESFCELSPKLIEIVSLDKSYDLSFFNSLQEVIISKSSDPFKRFFAVYLILEISQATGNHTDFMTHLTYKEQMLTTIFYTSQTDLDAGGKPLERGRNLYGKRCSKSLQQLGINYTQLCAECITHWGKIYGVKSVRYVTHIYHYFAQILQKKGGEPQTYYFLNKKFELTDDPSQKDFTEKSVEEDCNVKEDNQEIKKINSFPTFSATQADNSPGGLKRITEEPLHDRIEQTEMNSTINSIDHEVAMNSQDQFQGRAPRKSSTSSQKKVLMKSRSSKLLSPNEIQSYIKTAKLVEEPSPKTKEFSVEEEPNQLSPIMHNLILEEEEGKTQESCLRSIEHIEGCLFTSKDLSFLENSTIQESEKRSEPRMGYIVKKNSLFSKPKAEKKEDVLKSLTNENTVNLPSEVQNTSASGPNASASLTGKRSYQVPIAPKNISKQIQEIQSSIDRATERRLSSSPTNAAKSPHTPHTFTQLVPRSLKEQSGAVEESPGRFTSKVLAVASANQKSSFKESLSASPGKDKVLTKVSENLEQWKLSNEGSLNRRYTTSHVRTKSLEKDISSIFASIERSMENRYDSSLSNSPPMRPTKPGLLSSTLKSSSFRYTQQSSMIKTSPSISEKFNRESPSLRQRSIDRDSKDCTPQKGDSSPASTFSQFVASAGNDSPGMQTKIKLKALFSNQGLGNSPTRKTETTLIEENSRISKRTPSRERKNSSVDLGKVNSFYKQIKEDSNNSSKKATIVRSEKGSPQKPQAGTSVNSSYSFGPKHPAEGRMDKLENSISEMMSTDRDVKMHKPKEKSETYANQIHLKLKAGDDDSDNARRTSPTVQSKILWNAEDSFVPKQVEDRKEKLENLNLNSNSNLNPEMGPTSTDKDMKVVKAKESQEGYANQIHLNLKGDSHDDARRTTTLQAQNKISWSIERGFF